VTTGGSDAAGTTGLGSRDRSDSLDGHPNDSTASDSVDSTDSGDSITSADSTTSADPTTSVEPTVGPETESGALKDPVPDGAFATSSSSHADWLELQGRFVDDPEGAVREAGALVETALAELRSRIETGSTEDLRTAFRRYRELHTGLK
jgi:hypothetical protein